MICRYGLFAMVLVIGVGAGLCDGADRWIDATERPPLLIETSVEIRDRSGALLRAYPVELGRIRMALHPKDVDPAFLKMLITY